MLALNMLRIPSIKGKIVFLSFLGILGMGFITGINSYLANSMKRDTQIGALSQGIVRDILEISMIEKDYLSTGEKKLLGAHEKFHDQLIQGITEVKPLVQGELVSLANNIFSIQEEHQQVFQSVVKTREALEHSRAQLAELSSEVRSAFGEIVKAIDEEEALLVITDQTLDPNKNRFRMDIKDFRYYLNEEFLNLQDLFVFSNEENYQKVRTENQERLNLKKENILRVLSFMNDPEYEKTWKEVEVKTDEIIKTAAAIFSAWKANKDLKRQLKHSSQEIQKTAMEMAALSQESLAKSRKASDLIGIVFSLAGVVILIVLSMATIRSITKPLNQVVAGLKDIAEGEGDLKNRLNVKSQGEMGELAKWFNIFIEKIQVLIRDMAQHAAKLQTASQGLLEISENMSSGAEQTSSKASTVADAGEQMSVNMNSVASAMSEAASNVNMVASSVEEMRGTISEIAENAEKARHITSEAVAQTESASGQISELGASALDIGKVIETITEISEQVNLLALNATIEAARAGDAGKGFAVVANEIKELARQTAEATNEIKQRVEGIQSSTQGTVAEIERITQVVDQVNQIVDAIATAVEEQSVTTQEIAQNVNQVSQGIGEVNENVSQSSTVSAEIAKEISEVKHAANDMSDSSLQVNQSSGGLSELAEKLNQMVGRFKV